MSEEQGLRTLTSMVLEASTSSRACRLVLFGKEDENDDDEGA